MTGSGFDTVHDDGLYTEVYYLDGDSVEDTSTPFIYTNSLGVTPQSGVTGSSVTISGYYKSIAVNALVDSTPGSELWETDPSWSSYQVHMVSTAMESYLGGSTSGDEIFRESRTFEAQPGCMVKITVHREKL